MSVAFSIILRDIMALMHLLGHNTLHVAQHPLQVI
jgi:hypothetical protein